MAAKENFDSIFDDTKKGAKKKSAKKAAVKKTVKPAAKKVKPAAVVQTGPEPLQVDRFGALSAVLHNHEAEALYRKGKEDRVLVLSCALLAALIFGVMILLAIDTVSGWFGRFVLRLFFAGSAALVGVAAGSILELNRKRLQDLLSMIVKIHESFGFYKEGMYPTGNGAFFPNTYKFIGSINDDETNYAQLIVKIASVGAVVAILLLS